VAIELKSGDFKPEYAGKMNFYLNILDDFVRESDENPSIGIILCAGTKRIEVEYALRSINKPVSVAEYTLTKNLPKELAGKLPDAKQIEAEILREIGVPLKSGELKASSFAKGDLDTVIGVKQFLCCKLGRTAYRF
jgi:hypothetical protein